MACIEHKILAEIVLPLSTLVFFDVYADGNDQEQLNPHGVAAYATEVLYTTQALLINWLDTGKGKRFLLSSVIKRIMIHTGGYYQYCQHFNLDDNS